MRRSPPDIIAIDGKSAWRNHALSEDRALLHLVSAMSVAPAARLGLGSGYRKIQQENSGPAAASAAATLRRARLC
jgi:hypothetical protein